MAVLVVCEGNQCRSPVAEHILRTSLGEAQPVRGDTFRYEFMSAGTRAFEGLPIHPLTAQAMAAAGLAVPAHSSARLVPEAVQAADLILTADRAQRAIVAGLADGAASRTFTLVEFASLAAQVATEGFGTLRPDEFVAAAAAARSVSWNDPAYDLPDPIAGDVAVHAMVFDQVAHASATIASLLYRA